MKNIIRLLLILAYLVVFIFFGNGTVFGKEIIKESSKYDEIDFYNIVVSPDGKHSAFAVKSGGNYFVVRDGVEGKKYNGKDYYGIYSLQYSSDSKSLKYIVRGSGKYAELKDSKGNIAGHKPDKSFAVKDGVELGEWQNLTYSPDGRHSYYEYGVYENNRIDMYFTYLNKDGKNLGRGYNVTFDPNNPDSIFYISGNEKTGLYLLKDGKKISTLKSISTLGYKISPDGKSIAYSAHDGTAWYGMLYKDGIKLGLEYGYEYSPDGKSFAYVLRDNWTYYIIKDGVNLGEGERFIYSPDGKSFTYIGRVGGKYYVVKDGIKGAEYTDFISNMTYSPDGKSFVYTVGSSPDEKVKLVINGIEEKKAYDDVTNIIFSPDSKSLVYFLKEKDGKIFVVKDGAIIGETFLGRGCSPVFSSNSKHFAYVKIKDGKKIIVKDGIEIGEGYYPRFSINGDMFYYISLEGGKQSLVKIFLDSSSYINDIKTKKLELRFINNQQQDIINNKISNFSLEKIKSVVGKIDILLGKEGLSERNRIFLEEIKTILSDKMDIIEYDK